MKRSHPAALVLAFLFPVLAACAPGASPAASDAAGPQQLSTGAASALTSAAAAAATSVAASATVGATAAAAASAAPAAPAVSRCANGDITAVVLADTAVRKHAPWKGANGLTLSFTNVGSRTCWLYGYPGVEFYAAGKKVSTGSSPASTKPPLARVTLQPGRAAFSEVVWFDQSGDGVAVDRIGVIAPDQTQQTRVPVALTVRLDTDYRGIDVEPLTATLDPKPGPGPR
jgi:hypothetical protein